MKNNQPIVRTPSKKKRKKENQFVGVTTCCTSAQTPTH